MPGLSTIIPAWSRCYLNGGNNMKQDISKAKNPDLRASLASMQRAALMARKTAIQTETYIVIVEGDELVRVSADELRQIASEGNST